MRFAPLLALILCASAALGAGPVAELPGLRADGSVLLPNQWSLRPVGKQIPVGDFPVNIALDPTGTWAAVLHAGYSQHEVVVLEVAGGKVVSRSAIEEGFYGLAFTADGRRLFVSGSGTEALHVFDFAKGYLSNLRSIALRDPKQRGVPAGLALSSDGQTAYVCNLWAHTVSKVVLGKGEAAPQVSDLALGVNPDAARPLPEETGTDDPSITKRERALQDTTASGDPFPYACVLDEKKGRLYVSLWNQASVAVIDTKAWKVLDRWPVEGHPNEMLLARGGRRLFVANANHNTVTVLDTESGRASETLLAELQPNSPPGNTPNSLALSPDGGRLFVANANINTVSVFDVAKPGEAHSLGFIPVGWYPTSVRISPKGDRLLVANGKGSISRANPNGPAPGRKSMGGINEYIAELFRGTVTWLELPAGEKQAGQFDEKLAEWTGRAFQCLPRNGQEAAAGPEDSPIPRKAGQESPIRHVIYILKENRTYDQVLGDMKEGNGSPALCLFPEEVTPNHHALAREFVLLDNFYVESEVSADGHEWSMGAYASDFVEKTWPLNYGHNRGGKFPYPSEGGFPLAAPAGGYLWDRAKEAGITYRSYGEWVGNGRTPSDPGTTSAKALIGHFDPYYRSFDMAYPDAKRADRFIAELGRFEQEGEMPRLQILRLPSDHTSGTSPGRPTPRAYMADNDLALGRVVEAVSKSKFWPSTAIFVVEDDAQNGPDHVDAHRTVAFAISPYVRRASKDSTLYSTSSMLRTMELILGLKPMSQFDAAAQPMVACFQGVPDLRPYTAKPVTVDMSETNAKTAWGAGASRKMNFAKEDAADDLLLNEVIWRSVRGPESPMPAPVRAAFVFTKNEDADEDDD